MGPVLRTAVVTAAWLLVQGIVGLLLLGRKGRPYKAFIVVLHILLFLPTTAGWVYTVSAYRQCLEITLGHGLLRLCWVGCSLSAAGKKVPAPRGFVLAHKIGAAAALAGSLAGIVLMLFGV